MKVVENSGPLGGPVRGQSRQLTRRKCHHRVEIHHLNNQHSGWCCLEAERVKCLVQDRTLH